MKTLKALATPPSYLDRYVGIRDSKHQPVRDALVAIQPMVTARYQLFDAAVAAGTLAGVGGSPAALAAEASLRACYNSPTKRLTTLKADIKSAQGVRVLSRCPMCSTTLPGTTDHHMPAVKFPEFAVHGLNLVPCCATCNSIKDDDWLDPQGQRIFLHPFLDPIPAVPYLAVQLQEQPMVTAVGAKFSIQQAGMPAPAWALIQAHYTKLRLIDRYNDLASDEIETILSSCKSYLDSGGPSLVQYLQLEAVSEAHVFGMSNWRAVLRAALAAHPDLPGWIAARP